MQQPLAYLHWMQWSEKAAHEKLQTFSGSEVSSKPLNVKLAAAIWSWPTPSTPPSPLPPSPNILHPSCTLPGAFLCPKMPFSRPPPPHLIWKPSPSLAKPFLTHTSRSDCFPSREPHTSRVPLVELPFTMDNYLWRTSSLHQAVSFLTAQATYNLSLHGLETMEVNCQTHST